MLRMEISLFLVLILVAFIYFSAEPRNTLLYKTFSKILIVVLVHLVLDGATVYTVNHLETVNSYFNEILHRFFIATMVYAMYLFYEYISILCEEETGKKRKLQWISKIFLFIAEIGAMLLPVHYAITEQQNYSDGIHASVCYVSVAFYLVLCIYELINNWKAIENKKKLTISLALGIEVGISLLQAFHPTWLISGMGLTLMTMAFYLTLENPDILRAELVEQKMATLYLKSQVNPHFLYNTLDTIRIQAQIDGDKKVADLLMSLADFFRMSVKKNEQMSCLDDEVDLLEAYMNLMCYRYPQIVCTYDIDPDLGGVFVPNFILQPIVENSLLHGLKNKGYRGEIMITAHKTPSDPTCMEIMVVDNGSGFTEEAKKRIDEMLSNYNKHAFKLEGNSIGILNVQKRIKLLCGKEYGLSYIQNKEGGVSAHLLLPILEEERK